MKKVALIVFKGQSLIEIVVAVGIMALVLVGVSDLITRSLSLASFQAKKNIAINIANSQLTHFRQEKELNPTAFFASVAGNPTVQCFEVTEPVIKKCVIKYDNTGIPNGTKMTVSVDWSDGDKTITTELNQILAKPTK
jgi:type II secretory pathway pseudopilin PulG